MNKKQGWKGARYQDRAGSQAATKAFNVKVELNYINSEYDLEVLRENNINEQGLLLIGKLIPRQSSLPEFSIRWDEKGDHLNVDMNPDKKCWEKETNGYKGHRPQKASDHPGRAFSLVIRIPKLNIFDGVISFNLARDIEARVTIGLHADAEISVKSP